MSCLFLVNSSVVELSFSSETAPERTEIEYVHHRNGVLCSVNWFSLTAGRMIPNC